MITQWIRFLIVAAVAALWVNAFAGWESEEEINKQMARLSRFELYTPIAEADYVVIARAEWQRNVDKELVYTLDDVKILHSWTSRASSKPSSQMIAKGLPTTMALGNSVEIVVLNIGRPPIGEAIIGSSDKWSQLLFLKVVSLTPEQIKKYGLKGTELVCRPCRGYESAIDLNMEEPCFPVKHFKERYKITTSDGVVKAVSSLCAWRDLKDKKSQLDYLLKLLNDEPKNQLYLDNVPKLVEHLGCKLKNANDRYSLESPTTKESKPGA